MSRPPTKPEVSPVGPTALREPGACEIGTGTRDSVGGLAAVGARGFPPDARDGKGTLL